MFTDTLLEFQQITETGFPFAEAMLTFPNRNIIHVLYDCIVYYRLCHLTRGGSQTYWSVVPRILPRVLYNLSEVSL